MGRCLALKRDPGLKREGSASLSELIGYTDKIHHIVQNTGLRSACFDAPE
jgi:hypothetical protein